MSTPMTTEHESAVALLRTKLTRIEELEAEVAPKGVSFAMRGQEDLAATASNCIVSLRDPIVAADAVISVLEDAKAILSDADAIAARATALVS